MSSSKIPGSTRGTTKVARSPITDEELHLLEQTVMLTGEDLEYLRMAGDVLDDQVEAILDVWYDFVGSHPHLLHYFNNPDGTPNTHYLAAVRQRFGQWIRDTCAARYDRDWLDYQHEIALRHTRAKKNRTDGVVSAADHINLRYLIAFIAPISTTIVPFLAKKGHTPELVGRMHKAWLKSVVLQIALWSQPYARPGMY